MEIKIEVIDSLVVEAIIDTALKIDISNQIQSNKYLNQNIIVLLKNINILLRPFIPHVLFDFIQVILITKI